MENVLRKWRIEDAPVLAKHANNPNVAKFLTDGFPHPYSLEDAESFISMVLIQKPPERFFAIVKDDEAIGSISLTPQTDIHCKNMEIGYFLAEEYWGQGIMTSAIRELVEYGFRTFDINRIFARPFGTNLASQRVLEKAGFRLEARLEKALYKNGVFLDEMIYAIRKPM